MSFKSYENDGGNGGVMPEGDYEVVLLDAKEDQTKSGIPTIKFDFQVRSDVEQKYQKKHIFKNFYRDDDTGEWPMQKIGKFANALGIPKDEEFELGDLCGLCCILHMKPYTKQDGTVIDSVFYSAPTKAGQIPKATIKHTESGGFTNVDPDEELPF